ncbi:MAG TPA: IS481 family transposase [Hyphomicrobiaceae bacterium]
MNVHKNARLTPYRRAQLVAQLAQGTPLNVVARAFSVSRQTAAKWRERYRATGLPDDAAWMQDRSSRPHHSPRQIEPPVQLGARVLRQQRWTCAEIAAAVGVSAATIARGLRRVGMSRRLRMEPPPMGRRYEHAEAGDLVHLDTKKLGRIRGLGHRITGQRTHRTRGIGWEFLHIAIDDHSRVAYMELLADERGPTMSAFLRRALRWFRTRGVPVRRILTDNGAGYISRSFRATCRGLQVVHRRTRPYTPRTNGKAERFIQTALREWAYRRPYYTSFDRSRALPGWLEHYNAARPHRGIGGRPPLSRLAGGNNLMLVHS